MPTRLGNRALGSSRRDRFSARRFWVVEERGGTRHPVALRKTNGPEILPPGDIRRLDDRRRATEWLSAFSFRFRESPRLSSLRSCGGTPSASAQEFTEGCDWRRERLRRFPLCRVLRSSLIHLGRRPQSGAGRHFPEMTAPESRAPEIPGARLAPRPGGLVLGTRDPLGMLDRENVGVGLMKPSDVMALLAYTDRDSFTRMSRRTGLPRIRINKRVTRYDPVAVQAWIRRRSCG